MADFLRIDENSTSAIINYQIISSGLINSRQIIKPGVIIRDTP